MTSVSPTIAPKPLSPWGATTTTTPTNSPKLQDILDAELARQLYESELQALEDLVVDDVYAHMQTKGRGGPTVTGALDDPDYWIDDADEIDAVEDAYLTKIGQYGRRGMGGGGGHKRKSTLDVFDKRTQYVLGKLTAPVKISAVKKRVHSSAHSLLHHAVGSVEDEVAEEPTSAPEYLIKIIQAPASDYTKGMTHESLERSGRPLDAAMIDKSVRRQLKTQIEREYSSLVRAVNVGVKAPKPVAHKEHILITEFLGENARSAPRLRDVKLTPGQLLQAYVDVLGGMRLMYQNAKLVHGQLTEYNILYHNHAAWIVDFAHAVDRVHIEDAEAALVRDVRAVHGLFDRLGLEQGYKHRIGLLSEDVMLQIVTRGQDAGAARILDDYPCFKPYFYRKKE